jgi:hypothetical protein
MLVVEISSTGAEILYLMVPEPFLVKLLFGNGSEISTDFVIRLVVNARERDMAAKYNLKIDFLLNVTADFCLKIRFKLSETVWLQRIIRCRRRYRLKTMGR